MNPQRMYRVIRFLALMAESEYSGSVTIQFSEGTPRFVRTEAGYEPDDLPGDDAAAVGLLAQMQADANK